MSHISRFFVIESEFLETDWSQNSPQDYMTSQSHAICPKSQIISEICDIRDFDFLDRGSLIR